MMHRKSPFDLRARLAAAIEGLKRRVVRPGDASLWPVALVVGLAVGYAVVLFRVAISALQTLFYGADDLKLHSVAAGLPWYVVVAVPVIGGVIVGQILTRFTPEASARGVADVIRAACLRGGRVEPGPGLASAGAALVTLSTGGSTGREGPAIHIGAVIASVISRRLGVTAVTGRDILGCCVAAAVAASFNAPIAGAIFALEVVLRHYALHSFGAVVVSGVGATVVSRIFFGDVTEYSLPPHTVEFYWEMPAFLLLGLLCGLVAVAMMRAIFVAETVGDRVQALLRIPDPLRPAAAGLVLGLMALAYPHIIGVGYETTSLALTSTFDFWTCVAFAVVKVAAVAVTLAGRMGGGVFAPALMLGALTGSAFGAVAIDIFPSVSGSQGLYALAGTGAMAAAVLGAPISSTLIVFELTGDWQTAIAVLIAVPMASVVSDRLGFRSFFIVQLERQGLRIADGPQGYLKRTLLVRHSMRPRGAENGASDTACWELHAQGLSLSHTDTLERALPIFERYKHPFIPVMAPGEGDEPELMGALFQSDALRTYVRRLEDELAEEHR